MISVKHNHIYLFYFDNMFQSTNHHQAISTKLRKRCNAVHNSTETRTHIQADPPIRLKN